MMFVKLAKSSRNEKVNFFTRLCDTTAAGSLQALLLHMQTKRTGLNDFV